MNRGEAKPLGPGFVDGLGGAAPVEGNRSEELGDGDEVPGSGQRGDAATRCRTARCDGAQSERRRRRSWPAGNLVGGGGVAWRAGGVASAAVDSSLHKPGRLAVGRNDKDDCPETGRARGRSFSRPESNGLS